MLFQFRRNQIFLNGIGMYPIVDFGEIAPDIPAELPVFLIFEALELLDKIKLKF